MRSYWEVIGAGLAGVVFYSLFLGFLIAASHP